MGQILSNPVIDKEHHEGFDTFTAFGLCAMQGWRMNMEDAHIVELNIFKDEKDTEIVNNKVNSQETGGDNSLDENFITDHMPLYGVFDGHGGSAVARFCGKNFNKIFKTQLTKKLKQYNAKTMENHLLKETLEQTFLETDQALMDDDFLKNDHSGNTCTCIIISKATNSIICANAGDSRTVLASNGNSKALSFDHKPSIANETSRIIAADGFVEMDRVNGNLALSRAIGDFEFKSNKKLSPMEQIVTVFPEILIRHIDYKLDDFIILGCDGIWDCLSSQLCVDLVYYGINDGNMTLNDIASKIIDVCCAPNTEGSGIGCDNMSIIIVALLRDSEDIDSWFNRIRNKKIKVSKSFQQVRREVFDSHHFQENDKNIFSVSTKKNEEKLVNEHRTSLEEADDNKDSPSSVNRKITSDDADKGENNESHNIGVMNLEAIKALLEAGIHIGQRSDTTDGSSNSNEEEHSFFQSSPISDLLVTLSGAVAGEATPFNSDEEIDQTEEPLPKIESLDEEKK